MKWIYVTIFLSFSEFVKAYFQTIRNIYKKKCLTQVRQIDELLAICFLNKS